MTIVLRDAWRMDPLAWIHRGEASDIADELHRAGQPVRLAPFRADDVATLRGGPLLLRLSDPVMLVATEALARASVPYVGPGAAALARCYDKHAAYRVAAAAGLDCPATVLGDDADSPAPPRIAKPRRGSDSIGLRCLGAAGLPVRLRNADWIVQTQVLGVELTVAIVAGRVGMPLRLELPAGTPYTFLRKYVLRPGSTPLAHAGLAARVREAALKVARALRVDWAARVDFILETATDRLFFLECDAAPLVGPRSAFAASLAAAGVDRATQLALLLAGRVAESGEPERPDRTPRGTHYA